MDVERWKMNEKMKGISRGAVGVVHRIETAVHKDVCLQEVSFLSSRLCVSHTRSAMVTQVSHSSCSKHSFFIIPPRKFFSLEGCEAFAIPIPPVGLPL
jgi:hypothetical protein